MKKELISKSVKEVMIKELANLEDQRSLILDKFYSEPSSKEDDFDVMVEKYIHRIENFIKNASTADKEDMTCPFVIIGSNVEITDLHGKESYIFRIVSPLINETPANVNCVSYLSPLGEALLLKEVGDELDIAISSSVLKYKITGIWLM
jgi:transcription elongation factor GreA